MHKSRLLLILLTAATFAGCPTGQSPSTEEPPKVNNFQFNKEYWGEWIRLDTGQSWYITDTDVVYNKVSYPNKITLRKENANAIEVKEGSRTYYIYASRVKNASFTGRVVDGSGGGVIGGSEQGVGSISVIISNLNNASDNTIVITDMDGNFTVEEIIPWDTYEVTIDGKTWTVAPGDGDDVGIMALRDGVNLKAYLTTEDADRLYADREGDNFNIGNTPGYGKGLGNELSINIENVGNKNASDTTYVYYTLESPGLRSDKYVTLYTQPGQYVSLGGLKPGKAKSLKLMISSDAITEEFEYKKIGITITDPAAGITWKDYASLKINTQVRLHIEAQSTIQGVVIAPFKKAYYVRGGITLPWTTGDYILILTGQGKSMTYSLGVDIEPSTQWDTLTDQNIYKPQNTEETSASIRMHEQKMAFLFANGIDYWRINMGNARP